MDVSFGFFLIFIICLSLKFVKQFGMFLFEPLGKTFHENEEMLSRYGKNNFKTGFPAISFKCWLQQFP